MHSTAHLVDKYRVPLRERERNLHYLQNNRSVYNSDYSHAIPFTYWLREIGRNRLAPVGAVCRRNISETKKIFCLSISRTTYIQSQRRFRWETVFTTLWVINSCRRHALLFYYHCSTRKCALWSLRCNFAVSFTRERFNRRTALKIIKEIYI